MKKDYYNMSKEDLEYLIVKANEKKNSFIWDCSRGKMPNFAEAITEDLFTIKSSLFCHKYKGKTIIMEHPSHMRFSNKLTNIAQCEWIYKGFLKDKKLRIREV